MNSGVQSVARQWQRASSVSHRWRAAADEVQLWKVARKLVRGGQLNWSELQETEGDKAAKCWQSSSTSREEGKQGLFSTFCAFSEMVISEITHARLNNSNVISHFSHSGVDGMADNTSARSEGS